MSATGVNPSVLSSREQAVFDAVEAGEARVFLALFEVGGGRVDGGIEVGEAGGDRRDALVGGAGRHVERACLLRIARLHRIDEGSVAWTSAAVSSARNTLYSASGPMKATTEGLAAASAAAAADGVTRRVPRGLLSRPQVMA